MAPHTEQWTTPPRARRLGRNTSSDRYACAEYSEGPRETPENFQAFQRRWTFLHFLPLVLGPLLGLAWLLVSRWPKTVRTLQVVALAYTMFSLIYGLLLWNEFDYF